MLLLFEGANIPPDGPLFPESTFHTATPTGSKIQEGQPVQGYRRPYGAGWWL